LLDTALYTLRKQIWIACEFKGCQSSNRLIALPHRTTRSSSSWYERRKHRLWLPLEFVIGASIATAINRRLQRETRKSVVQSVEYLRDVVLNVTIIPFDEDAR
jgi:hypothetical protein